jgi:integrase
VPRRWRPTRAGWSGRSTVTVAAYLGEWLENQRPNLRLTTHSGYSRAIVLITSCVGARALQWLSPMDVESMYARLLTSGRRNGGELSAKTVRHAHTVLRRALADAERLGLVARNAAAVARPPALSRVEFPAWSSDELGAFLEFVADDRLSAAWVLLASTGMRRGEVLGLRWAHVDLDDASLSVVSSLTTVGNVPVFSEPKTAKSRRRISLDRETVEELRRHRKRQRVEKVAAGPAWANEADLVFTDELGGLVNPDWFSREFARLADAAGLPHIRLHDLRHSYATVALKAGVHPKVISERLGHATVGITLDLYSHVSKGLDSEAADLVASKKQSHLPRKSAGQPQDQPANLTESTTLARETPYMSLDFMCSASTVRGRKTQPGGPWLPHV